MAATARLLGSTRRMGTQSAVWTPRRRPGRLVTEASPRQGSVGAASKRWITSEWIWFREMSLRPEAPRADWKRRRFSRTFSLVSHSVKPRLRTLSPSWLLTPPGLVLKPWMSQESFERAGTWRICVPRTLSVLQESRGAGEFRRPGLLRFLVDVFVRDMAIPV